MSFILKSAYIRSKKQVALYERDQNGGPGGSVQKDREGGQ